MPTVTIPFDELRIDPQGGYIFAHGQAEVSYDIDTHRVEAIHLDGDNRTSITMEAGPLRDFVIGAFEDKYEAQIWASIMEDDAERRAAAAEARAEFLNEERVLARVA